MHRLLRIILLFFLSGAGIVHAQQYQWAYKSGSSGSLDRGRAIVSDSVGNVYITGDFEGTCDFGGNSSGTALTGKGSTDAFVCKYDSTGKLIWVFNIGGPGIERGNGIAVDPTGNVYVTGTFEGNTLFGTSNLTSYGGSDIFVAKYKKDGTFVWAKKYGGFSDDVGSAITCDPMGNIILTGSFKSNINFGGGTVVSVGNSSDIFIAKYDSAGTHIWSKQGNGPKDDLSSDITMDVSGNIYITGAFEDSITFGSTKLFSNGKLDIFLAKYTPSGILKWAKSAGGPDMDAGSAVACDPNKYVYQTGYFNLTASFGSNNITSKGATDLFIAKIDSGGIYQWVQNAGGPLDDAGHGITADSGGVLMIGSFNDTLSFGGNGTIGLNANGSGHDIVVTRLSNSGIPFWAKGSGGTLDDEGTAIAQSSSKQIFITGFFEITADFDTINLAANGNSKDIYAAKMVPTPPPLVNFGADAWKGCAPQVVQFSDSSSGPGLTSWFWDFGNGNTSTAKNPPPVTYSASGLYYVKLIVTDNGGKKDSITKLVRIFPKPAVSFSATPKTGCAPFATQFSHNSNNSISTRIWIFGDGSSPGTVNPVSHTYLNAGIFSVRLTLTDTNGCTNTDSMPNYIRTFRPDGGFTITPQSSCPPNINIQFTDTSKPGGSTLKTWEWDFGDGTGTLCCTTSNPLHTYTSSGTYTVRLIVKDTANCADTVSRSYTTPLCTAGKNDTICPGACATLVAQGTGGTVPYTYLWSSGGTTTNDTNIVCPPNNQTYTVTITDNFGISVTSTYSVTIINAPGISTNMNGVSCPGLCNGTATALASGTSGPYVYTWSNGQSGQSATGLCAQVYTVTVTYGKGCTKTATVMIPQPATMNISASSAINCVRGTNGSASVTISSGGTSPFTYLWTPGNATTQIVPNLTAGSYTVTVTDKNGCSKTASVLLNPAPTASFTGSPFTGCAPLSVTFTNSSVAGTGSSIAGYSWNLGISNSNAVNPSATYTSPGNYTIKLVIIDDKGCKDSIEKPNYIRATNKPTANFDFNSINLCGPFTVTLDNKSDTGFTYFWDFGDGGNANNFNPSHTYSTTGTFDVKLRVSGSGPGCADSIIKQVDIEDKNPVVVIGIKNIKGCLPKEYTFTDSSISPVQINQWLWEFPGGSTNTSFEPLFTFTDSGTYQVKLWVRNSAGCIGSTTRNIVVVPGCDLYIYNGFSPNGDVRNEKWEIDGIEAYPDNEVWIFNRWGEKVWHGKNYDNSKVVWDGWGDNGSFLPPGTYYYLVDVKTKLYKGWVEMVR